jgi:oxalate---CoA ligase
MAVNMLGGLLRDSAGKWPERIAVSNAARDRAVTYRDLDALVTDLALQLNRLGVAKGHTVAIVSDNCVEYVLALFAVVAAGASAAPLNPGRTPAQMKASLAALRADATIVPAHLYDSFVTTHDSAAGTAWKLALAEDPELHADLSTPPASGGRLPADTPKLDPPVSGDVAIMMLTSGTTAAPKVVPLTHANLLASIDGIHTVYRLRPDDATLLVMPLYHGHGLIAGLLATLASGGAAYVPSGGRFHAGSFWSDIVAAQATWYTAVPTIHQILLARAGSEYPKHGYPHLRFVRSCSAPLAPAVQHDLAAAFSAPVLEAYGMTETAHQVSSNPLPSDGPDKAGSVGLPTGVEIQVTGPDGRPAAAGETGEVWIRGTSVTSGYVANAQATAESFTGDWFHTGDLGHKDADGYLFLTGRIKEIINRGGEKISPAAIDAVLQSNPKVEDALSFGVPDQKYGEEINAAVVLRPGQDADEAELEQYSLARLSPSEAPKRIYFVRELPRTAKGAGDRRQLAARLASGR